LGLLCTVAGYKPAHEIPTPHPKETRETMKKIFSILTLVFVLASMTAFAQDTMKKDDSNTMKSDSSKKTTTASKSSTAKSKTATKKDTSKKDDSMKKSDDSMKKPQ
jgi:hypothetical protein